MNRDTLASFSKEELIALIEALTKQISMLTKRVEALEAELGKPPKNAGQFLYPTESGAQGQWRERDEAEGQGPCRRSPAPASEPDAAARGPG